MHKPFSRRNDSGARAIEYGLIAAGISVIIIAFVNFVSPHVQHGLCSERGEVNERPTPFERTAPVASESPCAHGSFLQHAPEIDHVPTYVAR